MDKDNTKYLLTKAYNAAHHAFRFGKPIAKGYTFVPNDKPFDPLNVEYDYFSKEHLETLDAVIDCLQTSDAINALKHKGISAFALAETKLFFTVLFTRYLQSSHTFDEMKAVNEKLDAIIHDLARLESKAQQKPESKNAPEPTPEEKSTFDFIMMKARKLSDSEREQFLNTKQGKDRPEFVEQWRKEMPYAVSDKTFANSLSLARNSLRAEKEHSPNAK